MTAITKLSAAAVPFSKMTTGRYDGKTVAAAFQTAQLIWEFDLWREGYAGAIVQIFKEGTTTYADVFEDVNLSTPADDPQTLISETLNGRTFGKVWRTAYGFEIGNASTRAKPTLRKSRVRFSGWKRYVCSMSKIGLFSPRSRALTACVLWVTQTATPPGSSARETSSRKRSGAGT